MKDDFDLPFLSWFASDNPVPAVDPADLKSMWMVQRNAPPSVPGQLTATSVGVFENACSPGADTQAVWYRNSMLQLLAGPLGMLSSCLHDGIPDDAVFQVAAVFPMERAHVGAVRQGLPFDVQGFLAEIEKQGNK